MYRFACSICSLIRSKLGFLAMFFFCYFCGRNWFSSNRFYVYRTEGFPTYSWIMAAYVMLIVEHWKLKICSLWIHTFKKHPNRCEFAFALFFEHLLFGFNNSLKIEQEIKHWKARQLEVLMNSCLCVCELGWGYLVDLVTFVKIKNKQANNPIKLLSSPETIHLL